jgi:hypothetical protein
MSNTTDVTGGKPIAVWSWSITGVSAINLLVAFYDIHERKREVLFFYFVPDTTRDKNKVYKNYLITILLHGVFGLLVWIVYYTRGHDQGVASMRSTYIWMHEWTLMYQVWV